MIEHCAEWSQQPLWPLEVEEPVMLLMVLHKEHEGLDALGKVVGEIEAPQVVQNGGDFMFSKEAQVPLELLSPLEHAQPDASGGNPLELPFPAGEYETLNVNGYEISHNSPHKVLKEVAEYMGVSRGGGKMALWKRLCEKLEREDRLAQFESANRLWKEQQSKPRSQRLPKAPSDEERSRHELTHLPYAAWCEYCVCTKAKNDAQRIAPEAIASREIPSLELDYCFGKVSEQGYLYCVLMVIDTWTKMLLAIPLESKGSDLKSCAEQIVRFSLSLQYYNNLEVVGDSEPTMKSLLETVRNVRQSLGYGTVVTVGQPYSKGRTAQVERCIQTVRRQASCLMEQVEDKCGVRLPADHPLRSWSFLHAAWLLNRFATHSTTRATPFEIANGRAYNGKIAYFGEFVHLLYRKTGVKMGPAWVPGLWLGKTVEGNEDCHLVATTRGVLKGRAIRRSEDPWRGPWVWCIKEWPFKKVQKSSRLGRLPSMPSPLPRIVEENEKGDLDAELVERYAEAHPADSDGEEVLPQNVASRDAGDSTSQPSAETTSAPVVHDKHLLEAPRTPTDFPPQGLPVLESSDSRMLDDTEVVERSPKQPRRELNQNVALASGWFSRFSSDQIRMVELMDDEQWEQEVGDAFYGDTELDDNVLEEYDVMQNQPLDEGRPPELSPEALKQVESEAGYVEIGRLLEMGVMEEPTTLELEDGVLLSTRSVFDWRVREGRWKRRCRFVAREFKGGMIGDATTFAPTSSMSSIRLMLVLHVLYRWSLTVLDIKDAFLLVPQQELVLVEKPEWWTDGHAGRLWVLRRCLPGQRNAASRWYEFLKEKLATLGFLSSEIQPSLFRHMDRPLVICSHVDDLMMAGVEDSLNWCLDEFKKLFTVTCGGVFPGVYQDPDEAVRFLKRRHFFTEDGVVVQPHEKYIPALVKLYKLEQRAPKPVPEGTHQLRTDGSELSPEQRKKFRSALGVLLYVSQDRIDIQHAVRSLSRFMSKPTVEAEQAVKHLILYLKGTESYGIRLPYFVGFNTKKNELFGQAEEEKQKPMVEVFCDADWAASENQRHSVSSGMVFIQGCLVVSWSRTQKSVALSSCESEYLSLCAGAAEGLYVKRLLEFVLQDSAVLRLYTDSSSCLGFANRSGVGRLKHLDTRRLWLQNEVKNRTLELQKVPTQLNISDLNTKRLSRKRRRFLMHFASMVSKGEEPGEKGFRPIGELEVQESLQRAVLGNHMSEIRRAFCRGQHSLPKETIRAIALMCLVPGHSAMKISEFDVAVYDALEIWWRYRWLLLLVSYLLACGLGVFFGMRMSRCELQTVESLEISLDATSGEFCSPVRSDETPVSLLSPTEDSDDQARVPLRYATPRPTAGGDQLGAYRAAVAAGEGPSDGGHLDRVADAAGESFGGEVWRSGVSPGVDSEGDVVMQEVESEQESDYSPSLDSRDEARLLAFWARVMPDIASAAQFEPPTLRYLFQHGNTAVYLSMLPDALSRTLKRRMEDLPQSWSMRIDVHLRVLLHDLYGDRDSAFVTTEQSQWRPDQVTEHEQFIQWLYRSADGV